MEENKESILHDFANYLRAEGQRLHTVNSNTNMAGQFLQWLGEEAISYLQVSYSDLLAYIDYHKARGNTKSTINGKLQSIRHFYNWLQQTEKVSSNPAEELRIKGTITRQPHDLIKWEDLRELYRNYPAASITGKRNKAILGMLIYQGLNSGEVAAIELKDLKLEEGKVYVPETGRSNARALNLESVQILQLQKYITRVRPVLLAMKGDNCHSDSLFISSGDGRRLDNSLSRLMRAAKKINPKIKDAKQIRASVITHWLTKHHIRQVQYMTGHRYVSSTERYRTDLLECLQEQIEELHPLNTC